MNQNELFFGFSGGVENIKGFKNFQNTVNFNNTTNFRRQLTIRSVEFPQLRILSAIDGAGYSLQYDGAGHGLEISAIGAGTGNVVAFNGLNVTVTTGTFTITGGIVSSLSSANFYVPVVSGTGSATATINGTTSRCRLTLGVGATSQITASNSYASCLIGDGGITEAASGTHPIISTLTVKGVVITDAAGATTTATTVYIEGAPSGTATPTNVYSMWVDDGQVRIDSFTSIGTTPSTSTYLILGASTTGVSSMRITPSANAPTSPVDGDVYYLDTNDRFMLRKNTLDSEIISASAVTTEALTSDTSLTITYNGTTYKLLAKA